MQTEMQYTQCKHLEPCRRNRGAGKATNIANPLARVLEKWQVVEDEVMEKGTLEFPWACPNQ